MKKFKSIFNGVGVALVTPFYHNKIDYVSMGKLIDNCLNNKAGAIIILATTGEGATITQSERNEIIAFCKEKINNKAKLIVSCGHNNFEICKQNIVDAKELGADAALVVTPYYNKTTQAGLIQFYTKLSELKFPIILYNVPARTGITIELKTIKTLIKNEWIYGIKESTTDILRINNLLKICKNKIAVYSGEDEINHIFYHLGGNGCISVTANILPYYVYEIYNQAKNKNYIYANKIQSKIDYLNKFLFVETNPIPVKQVLYSLNIISSNELRLPLVELSNKNKKKAEVIVNKTKKIAK